MPSAAVCIDCDRCKSFPEQTLRPDFIILDGGEGATAPRWLVVEMKPHVGDVTHIVRQLQAGATAIQSDPGFSLPEPPTALVPLVLREVGRTHRADVQRLSSASVIFFGVRRRILTKPCGTMLASLA